MSLVIAKVFQFLLMTFIVICMVLVLKDIFSESKGDDYDEEN